MCSSHMVPEGSGSVCGLVGVAVVGSTHAGVSDGLFRAIGLWAAFTVLFGGSTLYCGCPFLGLEFPPARSHRLRLALSSSARWVAGMGSPEVIPFCACFVSQLSASWGGSGGFLCVSGLGSICFRLDLSFFFCIVPSAVKKARMSGCILVRVSGGVRWPVVGLLSSDVPGASQARLVSTVGPCVRGTLAVGSSVSGPILLCWFCTRWEVVAASPAVVSGLFFRLMRPPGSSGIVYGLRSSDWSASWILVQ